MPKPRRYRRPDHRYNRVRRPPPSEGFLVRDLARLAGVSVPTIKRYVRHGLPHPACALQLAAEDSKRRPAPTPRAQLRWCRHRVGKPAGKVVTAVARELVGFIWATGTAAESTHLLKTKKAA